MVMCSVNPQCIHLHLITADNTDPFLTFLTLFTELLNSNCIVVIASL